MPRRSNRYIECGDYYKIELYYPRTNRVCDYALISKSDMLQQFYTDIRWDVHMKKKCKRVTSISKISGLIFLNIARITNLQTTRNTIIGEVIIIDETVALSRQIPFWEKYTLSIDEAAAYFRIGRDKLYKIVSENKDADFILWNGTRAQIKRKKFENYIDKLNIL